ncbi:hypothetical protein ACF0H5_010173 [Mactra antiquata]
MNGRLVVSYIHVCGLLIHCALSGKITGDYCPPYVDKNNVTQSGYQCPTAFRLVGKSDFYCCWSDVNERQTCCNDRSRSLFHKDLTYGEEAIILNWPFLVLGMLILGMMIVLPYTQRHEAEMKQ